eukprot:symbB.v1.2.026194.t1/scaffold2598.1/size75169/3
MTAIRTAAKCTHRVLLRHMSTAISSNPGSLSAALNLHEAAIERNTVRLGRQPRICQTAEEALEPSLG